MPSPVKEVTLTAPRTLAAVLDATSLEAACAPGAHDAVVVGAGAAGGLAALLLAEAGLRVLVLDAGPPILASRPRSPYSPGAMLKFLAGPAGLKYVPRSIVPLGRAALRGLGWWRQPIQSRSAAWARSPKSFVDDRACPYVTPPGRPFTWIRARQLGGRMVLPGHGRQYFRFGPNDFAPTDGLSEPWPLEPDELDEWYDAVEARLDLSGRTDGVPWLPDSLLAHMLEPTADEASLMDAVRAHWPGARAVLGRFAQPLNALEQAAATGRLSCRQGAIVCEIKADPTGNVRGLVWLDQQSGTRAEIHAPLVFLCGSALESTRLLLLSRGPDGAAGLGASSGVLGRNLMDHILVTVWGAGPALAPDAKAVDGRSVFLPRFDARDRTVPPDGRGFGVQAYQFPASATRSHFLAAAYGEMLPRADNRVSLAPERRDAWGIPALHIDCHFDAVDLARARAQADALRDLARVASARVTRLSDRPAPPGSAVHECGTARMGRDHRSAVLDPANQCWEARGLYVTDGACFPSQGTQNPTLTILALTARACDHAIQSAREVRGRPSANGD